MTSAEKHVCKQQVSNTPPVLLEWSLEKPLYESTSKDHKDRKDRKTSFWSKNENNFFSLARYLGPCSLLLVGELATPCGPAKTRVLGRLRPAPIGEYMAPPGIAPETRFSAF